MTITFANFAGNLYAQLQNQLGANTANVVVMALAIAAFGAVIGMFWKTLSRRNIIEVDWKKIHGGFGTQVFERVKFGLEYVIIFPLATFTWFVVLTICLYFMSKTASIAGMMFIAISLVAATRACAYLDEEIAGDIAKVVPIAILGVFLAEPTMFSPIIVEQRLDEMSTLVMDALPYFAMLMALEVLLRVLFLMKRAVWPEKLER